MKFTDVNLLVMMDDGKQIEIRPIETYAVEVSCGSVQIEFLYGGLRTSIEAPIDRVEMCLT